MEPAMGEAKPLSKIGCERSLMRLGTAGPSDD
jgi:hypothetical protein